MLPFDFIILGTPLSQQAKNRNLRRWKSHVRACAQAKWPPQDQPVTGNIKIIVVYYHDGAALDTDNMLKPIQDALIGLIYNDDRQVTDITAGKRDINGSFRVRGLSSSLAEGFSSNNEFVHIRVEEAPNPQELI
jgi:crossover junction endodeoxyribonuclease RusA